jgi:hypothetical protein
MGGERALIEGLAEAATSGAGKRLFAAVIDEISGVVGATRPTRITGLAERSTLGETSLKAHGSSLSLPDATLMQTRTLDTRATQPVVKRLDDQSLASAGLLREQVERSAEGNLRPGVYKSDWRQFVDLNGFNQHRIEQLRRAEPLMRELKDKGLDEVYVGGSFITTKIHPGDIDFTAILNDDHSTALWQRVDFLRDKPKQFAEHMMLGFEARGMSDTSIHTLRFNRAQQEVGIVKLRLPNMNETIETFKR